MVNTPYLNSTTYKVQPTANHGVQKTQYRNNDAKKFNTVPPNYMIPQSKGEITHSSVLPPHSDTLSDNHKHTVTKHTHSRKKGNPLENNLKLSVNS